jgi:hypothetical protein
LDQSFRPCLEKASPGGQKAGVGDLNELKRKKPDLLLSDISGAGVLQVNRRILRMKLISDGINENKPCSGLSRLD